MDTIIEPGTYVALTYDLFDVGADGTEKLLHQVTEAQPETMIYGVTPNVLEPLLEAIKGLTKGHEFVCTLSPEEGFGVYNDELVRIENLPRSIFESDGKLDEEKIKPGAQIFLQTNMGQEVPAVVLEVTDKEVSVRVDFNHPLAGRTVKLRGKIAEVRAATADEIAVHSRRGGCSGCGGGCGDGDCGDSCGCDGGCCGQ